MDIGQVFDLALPGFEGLVSGGVRSGGVWQTEAAGERPLCNIGEPQNSFYYYTVHMAAHWTACNIQFTGTVVPPSV